MHLRRASLVLMTAAVLCVSGLVSVATASPAGVTAATPAELTAICEDLFAASTRPLAANRSPSASGTWRSSTPTHPPGPGPPVKA